MGLLSRQADGCTSVLDQRHDSSIFNTRARAEFRADLPLAIYVSKDPLSTFLVPYLPSPHCNMKRFNTLTDLEMAPHQAHPTSCLTPHSAEGPITPPATPPLSLSKAGQKFQLSKFLQRSRSRRWKHDEPRIDGPRITRPPVAKMKTTFPLIPPPSPSVTPSSSGLRRMSMSYNDLRALGHQHAALGPMTPLLPSHITAEPRDEGQSYIKFQSPWAQVSAPAEEMVDSLQIVSYYCNDEPAETPNNAPSYQESTRNDDDQSTASESMPVTPRDYEYNETFCSDESGWLANTTSHEERQRRFKSRFYQVVQRPWTDGYKEDGDEEVVSHIHGRSGSTNMSRWSPRSWSASANQRSCKSNARLRNRQARYPRSKVNIFLQPQYSCLPRFPHSAPTILLAICP